MINAKELRIGNTIRYTHDTDLSKKLRGTFLTVDLDTLTYLETGDRPDFYEPIPLTPEVLEKCGFEKGKGKFRNNGLDYYKKGLIYVCLTRNGEFKYGTPKGIGCKPTITYLHQLQNLFWCLCGKELEVNLH